MTDGQYPLRHYLHLEACRKKAKLSDHFYSFYDLKKEIKRAVKHDSDFKNLEDVACCILFLVDLCKTLVIFVIQVITFNVRNM